MTYFQLKEKEKKVLLIIPSVSRVFVVNTYFSYCSIPIVERGRASVLTFTHDRSVGTVDPCAPATPGRSTSGFHLSGKHCVHQMSVGEGG